MPSSGISVSLLRGVRAVCHSSPILRVLKLLVFWAGVTWGLGIFTFVCVYNCFYRVGKKSIQIFAFGQALLSTLVPYTACAAAASIWISQLHGFGLFHHDLARVNIVARSMQRSHRWVFLFGFLFVEVLFWGVRGLLWTFALHRLGGLVAFAGLLVFFCFGDFLHPASGIFPQQFRGAHRIQRDPWGLRLRSQTLGLWLLFATPSVGRTLPTRGSRLLVGIVPRQKAGTSRGTQPSRRCGRWNIRSWCCRACTAPSWGTSSGAEASWEEKSGRLGSSSLTHSLHLSLSPSFGTYIRTLVGLIQQPVSASSQTNGVSWINPGPW